MLRKIRTWLADLITGGEYSENKRALNKYYRKDLADVLEIISPTSTPFLSTPNKCDKHDLYSWTEPNE